jgi:hypothetical protein
MTEPEPDDPRKGFPTKGEVKAHPSDGAGFEKRHEKSHEEVEPPATEGRPVNQDDE